MNQIDRCEDKTTDAEQNDDPNAGNLERETDKIYYLTMENVQEYTVDRINRHVKRRTKTSYIVRWYGYTAGHDTEKLTEHIPKHFIDRYWRQRIPENRL